ncbi:MAG: hypothetical protein MUF75_00825 [Bacteroidia bacterium]|jgi:hypothetical protein|nr:hypothetical protein [Bacteroidia bacterium]
MKRPASITVLCVLGYISIVLAFPQVFSPQVKKLGLFMPVLSGVLVAANFMAYVGIWYMKRWGAELFLYSYFLKTILDILYEQTGLLFYSGQLFSLVFSIVLLRYYQRLDQNL